MWSLWLTWMLWLSPSVASAQDSGLAVAAPDQPARVEGPSRLAPLLGKPAPVVPWIDVIGVEGKSAKKRVETLRRMTEGRVVFIDFWATWCAPCIKSLPHGLLLAHRQPTDSLVVIFATYLDQRNTREKVQTFADHGYEDRYGVKFDGIIAMFDDSSAYRQWQSLGIPNYAVVDQNGIVRYQDLPRVRWTPHLGR